MGVIQYVKEWRDCEELPLSHKKVKNLWVEIKDSPNKEHLGGVHHEQADRGSLLTRPCFNHGKHCAHKLSS